MCFHSHDIFNVKSLKHVHCVLKSGFGDKRVSIYRYRENPLSKSNSHRMPNNIFQYISLKYSQ